MVRSPYLAAAFVCLVAAHARAEVLTEADFLSAVDADHPAVQALAEELATAKGGARSADLLENPSLEFEQEMPGNARQTTWMLSWSPPLDIRRGARRAAARAEVQAAESGLAWARLLLREEVRETYAGWALAAERESLLVEQARALRALSDQAMQRNRVGEESGLAARRLGLAAFEVEASAARAAAERAGARASVLVWRGGDSGDLFPARPSLPSVPDAAGVEAHPGVQRRAFEVAVAEARHDQSRGGALPVPQLRVGWQTLHDGDDRVEGAVFGVAVPLPIFNRYQGDRVQAKGRLQAARASLAIEQTRTAATLSGAIESYRRLRTSVVSATDELAASRNIMEIASAKFRLGESSVTDLLETMRSVTAAQMTWLDLYGAALEAHRRLELAMGRPLQPPAGVKP